MNDKVYMLRCLELAKKGLGTTYPNPLVGSVVVHNDCIIGEGWHRKAGTPHAEVHAIRAVKNKELLAESTLYVNLEPCNHHGKTPPCCDLIIEHRVKRVVIGTIDYHSLVNGSGIARLKNAGVAVTVGVWEAECQKINRRFFTFHAKGRPYIILKWAESADGFMTADPNQPNFPVSNKRSKQLLHKMRTEEQSILVGTRTALIDNPSLTARSWKGNNPLRLLLDFEHKIPSKNFIFDDAAPTIRIDVDLVSRENWIAQLLTYLKEQNIQSLIVEGGKQVLEQFIELNLFDEVRIFKSAENFGKGLSAPRVDKSVAKVEAVGASTDKLLTIRPNDTSNYF